jgi:hypothetical protein
VPTKSRLRRTLDMRVAFVAVALLDGVVEALALLIARHRMR